MSGEGDGQAIQMLMTGSSRLPLAPTSSQWPDSTVVSRRQPQATASVSREEARERCYGALFRAQVSIQGKEPWTACTD